MSHNDFDFIRKIQDGLELAEERMLKEKIKKGNDVVVSLDDEKIARIPATKIFGTYYEKKEFNSYKFEIFLKKVATGLFKKGKY